MVKNSAFRRNCTTVLFCEKSLFESPCAWYITHSNCLPIFLFLQIVRINDNEEGTVDMYMLEEQLQVILPFNF